jgi:hypothetical protein
MTVSYFRLFGFAGTLTLQPITMRGFVIDRYYYCGNLLKHYYATGQLVTGKLALSVYQQGEVPLMLVGRRGCLADFSQVLRAVQGEAIKSDRQVINGMSKRSKHLNDKQGEFFDCFDCPPIGQCVEIGLCDKSTPAWLFLHDEAPVLAIKQEELLDYEELLYKWFSNIDKNDDPPLSYPMPNRVNSELIHPPKPKGMDLRVMDDFMPKLKGRKPAIRRHKVSPEAKRYSMYRYIKL